MYSVFAKLEGLNIYEHQMSTLYLRVVSCEIGGVQVAIVRSLWCSAGPFLIIAPPYPPPHCSWVHLIFLQAFPTVPLSASRRRLFKSSFWYLVIASLSDLSALVWTFICMDVCGIFVSRSRKPLWNIKRASVLLIR